MKAYADSNAGNVGYTKRHPPVVIRTTDEGAVLRLLQ